MEILELLKQIEEKRAELAQLIEKHGLTAEPVLAIEKDFDQLVMRHLHQSIEAQSATC